MEVHSYLATNGYKVYMDGSVYQGEFDVNGLKTGFGTLTFFDNAVF